MKNNENNKKWEEELEKDFGEEEIEDSMFELTEEEEKGTDGGLSTWLYCKVGGWLTIPRPVAALGAYSQGGSFYNTFIYKYCEKMQFLGVVDRYKISGRCPRGTYTCQIKYYNKKNRLLWNQNLKIKVS